jgi:hypothetical protein
MLRLVILAGFAALVVLASSGGSAQVLDPAVHGLKRLEPLMFGMDGDGSKMAPMEYRLKAGQGYRWKIKASDLTEYAFVAPAFIRNVWVRKIEVGEVEIKAVTFDELEFENGGEAEVFFVAIRPGTTYEFGSKGLMERGVIGKIVIESTDAGAAAADAPAAEKGDDDGDDGKKANDDG